MIILKKIFLTGITTAFILFLCCYLLDFFLLSYTSWVFNRFFAVMGCFVLYGLLTYLLLLAGEKIYHLFKRGKSANNSTNIRRSGESRG